MEAGSESERAAPAAGKTTAVIYVIESHTPDKAGS